MCIPLRGTSNDPRWTAKFTDKDNTRLNPDYMTVEQREKRESNSHPAYFFGFGLRKVTLPIARKTRDAHSLTIARMFAARPSSELVDSQDASQSLSQNEPLTDEEKTIIDQVQLGNYKTFNLFVTCVLYFLLCS